MPGSGSSTIPARGSGSCAHSEEQKGKLTISEGSGANNGKKVKNGMEAKDEKEKNNTEAAVRDWGSEGSCKVKNSTGAEEKKVKN